MKIGIVGFGVVGKAAYNTFSEVYDIIRYDKYVTYENFSALINCDFVFIMVPTPFDCKENRVDDIAVSDTLKRLEDINYSGLVIIKSTIPPGSCSKYQSLFNLDISFNPEFLRESTTPNEDFKNQDTVVIGSDNKSSFKKIRDMYKKVLVSEAQYFHTSLDEAEFIKTSQNTMLASRVALANVIYDACVERNVDYEKVRDIAFTRFDIIGPHMTQVPGPDGHRGFGGKCLPKDIRAFNSVFNLDLLDSIIRYNDSLRDDLDRVLSNFESKGKDYKNKG